MMSRNEMPSMPSTYPAPIEGIQLFAAPSMNLNGAVSPLLTNAQNAGTSGSEIRNPPSAKILASQRMASLFSLGTNRSNIAPTSGVKRMIESMCDCIVSTFRRDVASYVSATASVIHVIKDEPDQSCGHDQRVPLHQPGLE